MNVLKGGSLTSPNVTLSAKWPLTVVVLGILSAVPLPILSIFSTSSAPSVHNLSAYAFFILEALAVLLNVRMELL